MSLYSSGVASNATATANAVRWELRAGARPFWLQELLISNEAATVVTLLLHRALAIGVTPTSPVSLVSEDGQGVASLAQTAIAWGTAPTVPTTSPIARVGFPATIGAAWFVTFKEPGLFVAASASLILINLNASSSALLGITARIND
jgi:hypothetical protein